MKFLMFLFLFAGLSSFAEPKVREIRTLYFRAAEDKASADKLLAMLSSTEEKSIPLLICYKGVAEMLQAKHAGNPIMKWKRFKRGKIWIESAVKKSPENVEIRFLRFSVQTNLPAFLGYNGHIAADKFFLMEKLNTIEDLELKQRAVKFLSSSKYCSEEEREQVKIFSKQQR
ncbi:hypothetical protein [Pedobacter heparinus]|uniref:hypothetical protein n=1 Tax=Pedobacter heparinus TaxID=984 RepID=UPI00292E6CA3|nr:hypothetical protein [Pedobacter heparinus]